MMKRERVIADIEARIAHEEVIRDMVKCIPIGQLVRLRVGYMMEKSAVPVGRDGDIVVGKYGRGWVQLSGYCVGVGVSFNRSSMVCDVVCCEFDYPVIRVYRDIDKIMAVGLKTAISFNHILGWEAMGDVKELVMCMGYKYRMPLFGQFISGGFVWVS